MFKKYTSIAFIIFIQVVACAHADQSINNDQALKALEAKYNRKLGLYAFDTNTNAHIAYNENMRFPFQSTFKLIAVSTFLQQHQKTPMLNEKVVIGNDDVVPWGPVSDQYLNKAVSYKILCEAAISYSDNTAINLIVKRLGGIDKINQFAHDLGIMDFSLNHTEPALNSNPKILADTTTPKSMAGLINKILNSNVLSSEDTSLLRTWLHSNTTGYDRIRSGVPLGWSVADKTGSGQFGVANDLGIVWSPACKPVFLSIYTVGADKSLHPESQMIADATRLTMKAFSKLDPCYQFTDITKVFKNAKN